MSARVLARQWRSSSLLSRFQVFGGHRLAAWSGSGSRHWTKSFASFLVGGALGFVGAHELGDTVAGKDISINVVNLSPTMVLGEWQELGLDYLGLTGHSLQLGSPNVVYNFLHREAKNPRINSTANLDPDLHSVESGNVKSECLTRYTIADAVAKASPAVVNINSTSGIRGLMLEKSEGSGFIIESNGIILTNAHVVTDSGSGSKHKLIVTMQDGRTFDGEVVNFDLTADIAVVKVHSKTPLPTVSIGSSQTLRSGEWVIAVGSPFHLQNTVTVGIVSCVDRKSSEIGLRGVRSDYIQTDAAINQGNSGGPLLNLDGEVIGINTMKAFPADGVSFAIPIDTAVKIAEQLRKHGRVLRPWIGIKMLELNPNVVSQLREMDPSFPDVTSGIFLPQVIPFSPAEKGGLKTKDIIVEFDGKPVKSISQILESLGDRVGEPVKVVVQRADGTRVVVTVVPEEVRSTKQLPLM